MGIITNGRAETAGRPWKVAAYLRLSREDDREGQSASITAQERIVRDWARDAGHEVVAVYKDDGYTGTSFDRPGFARMIEDARAGAFDTIAVKDQSRFGRDYLNFGRWVDAELPAMGVRFYSIAEDFDSSRPRDYGTALKFPIVNITNEMYAANSSQKVKQSLDMRRRNGMFVGNFAPYGYAKDPADNSRLVIDPVAADNVRRIFRWRLEGMSPRAIADALNSMAVPCPLDHKRAGGSRQANPFKVYERSRWDATQVARLLANEVYMGTLAQGKRHTVSWRVHRVVETPDDEVVRVEGGAPAIVDARTFRLAAEIAARDTRTAPGEQLVWPLAGLVFCGDCGDSMYRKSNTYRSRDGDVRRYGYLFCSGHRADKSTCSCHTIRTDEVERAVRDAAVAAVTAIIDVGAARDLSEPTRSQLERRRQAQAALARAEAELGKARNMGARLYDDYAEGVITKAELAEYKELYARRARSLKAAVDQVGRELDAAQADIDADGWAESLRRWQGCAELTRPMAVELVDRVEVFEGKRVKVVLRHRDKIADVLGADGGDLPWER